MLCETKQVAIRVLNEELALAFLYIGRDRVPRVLDFPEDCHAGSHQGRTNRICVRDLDLKIYPSPKRVIKRRDIPSTLVVLFQHQLRLPEFEVGEWGVVSLNSNRKPGRCVEPKGGFKLFNREFGYECVPVSFFKHEDFLQKSGHPVLSCIGSRTRLGSGTSRRSVNGREVSRGLLAVEE
mgnify:CR=1 FL=1